MEDHLSVPLDNFKERELEILQFMAIGLSNEEIADKLFITKGTVRWYNKHIYSKLGTSRRTEAIAQARKLGLIQNQATDPSQKRVHKLPITTGPFIGRDTEIAELSDLLNNPDVRLLSIVAAGGMGKSRLSLELAHQVTHHFANGAAFIDLTPVRNPDDIAQIALSSLGLTVNGSQSAQEALLNHCREKDVLLIFDNVEHLLPGAGLFADLLKIAPGLKVIATSRERLNLRAETAFYLQPITQDADRLFMEIADMMRPNIHIGEDEQAGIARIVDLVGGLPLGLVLAATWVDTLSIPEIADEIERNLEFLSAELGDMPVRQRSIHAVIDPTWKRLTSVEQTAFMQASVFRGGFTRQSFQQVAGASVRTLQTLLSRSLISPGMGRRYDMHPLLRQYAREKLEAERRLAKAKQAHLLMFRDYAQNQASSMYSGQYLESLNALDIEQDNFRAALDWSLQGHEIEDGIQLLTYLCEFWMIRSQSIEAVAYLEKTLHHTRDANLLFWLGQFEDRLGRKQSATEHLHQAIALAKQDAAHQILAHAYNALGRAIDTTDADKAKQLHEQALAIGQELKDAGIIADCHNHLGTLAYLNHDPLDTIVEHFQNAMTTYKEQGDLRGISMITYNLSIAYFDEGYTQQARELCDHSLQLKRQIGDHAGIARRLSVLARWDISEEEFERAIIYLDESREICEEIGEPARLVYTLYTEGILRTIMTEFDQAEEILERGLQIAHSGDYHVFSESFNSYLAMIHLFEGRFQLAKQHLLAALDKHREVTTGWMSLIAYANYLWHTGEKDGIVPIAAVMVHHHNLHNLEHKYFLQPLYQKVENEIGSDAWQQAINAAADTTIEQLYQDIMARI